MQGKVGRSVSFSKSFFLLSSKRISKSLGLDRQWWGRGREARWLFFPLHFSPQFEGIWLSPPHLLRFNHSWRGLPGNPEARVLGGAVCVGVARGSVWGWGNFSVILFVRDVLLLSPASLVCSVSGVAAPGTEFESLQALCRTAGREVRVPREGESWDDVLLGDFPLCSGAAGNLREKGQEL